MTWQGIKVTKLKNPKRPKRVIIVLDVVDVLTCAKENKDTENCKGCPYTKKCAQYEKKSIRFVKDTLLQIGMKVNHRMNQKVGQMKKDTWNDLVTVVAFVVIGTAAAWFGWQLLEMIW